MWLRLGLPKGCGPVSLSLRRIAGGSRIGEKIWGSAYRQEKLQRFFREVGAIVQSMSMTGAITLAKAKEVERRAMVAAAAIQYDYAEAKGESTIEFLGVPVQVRAPTAQLHVRLRIAALVKSSAIGRKGGGGGQPFDWEADLIGEVADTPCEVDDALLEQYRLARETAADTFKLCTSPEEIADTLKSKKLFSQLDDSIVLEEAVIRRLLGDWGRARLLGPFLDILRTSSSLLEAEAKVQVLSKSALRSSTSRATQGELSAWVAIIVAMRKGVGPQASLLQ